MALKGDATGPGGDRVLVVNHSPPTERMIGMARSGYRDDLTGENFDGDDPGAVVGLILDPNEDPNIYKLDLSPTSAAELIKKATPVKRRTRRDPAVIAAEKEALAKARAKA